MIRLVVFGTPVSQGSKRAFARMGKNGKPVANIVDDNRDLLRAWRKSIRDEAKRRMKEEALPVIAGPAGVEIDFIMPKPTGRDHWRKRHDSKPDGDKLERAVFDALSGIVFVDDARVVECHWRKRYDVIDPRPRAEIFVMQIDERNLDV